MRERKKNLLIIDKNTKNTFTNIMVVTNSLIKFGMLRMISITWMTRKLIKRKYQRKILMENRKCLNEYPNNHVS